VGGAGIDLIDTADAGMPLATLAAAEVALDPALVAQLDELTAE
jgi:hypothetical protein